MITASLSKKTSDSNLINQQFSLFLRWFITISRDWQIRVALGLLWTVHMFHSRISHLPTYPKIKADFMSCCLVHKTQWELSGMLTRNSWERKNKNMLTFAVKLHTDRFLPPTCSSASLYACQPCRCKHTHVQLQTHMMQLFKACDIDRAQINLTIWQLSLHSAVFHTDRKTECFYLFSTPPPLSALSPLHYSEVIYNACSVMVRQYPSPLIIKQASSRGLWPLPILPPCHPPRSEHKTERKWDCIYRKGARESDQKEQR